MQRRAILLLILLAALAVFYASGVRQSGADIRVKEQALLEQLNQLDEQANEPASKQD